MNEAEALDFVMTVEKHQNAGVSPIGRSGNPVHDRKDICFVPDGDYVKFTPGLEKGVEEMCNLSAGIERQGIEKGIEKGKSEMIDFIARISKYSKEKIAEIGRLHGLL